MEFTLSSPRITKQTLLDKHTEEEYMSFYLGIVPDKDIHLNPLRADRHPTASFYRTEKSGLVFKDWKTNTHFNFIDIVMHKFGVGYGRAITIIANDFNISERASISKNTAAAKYNGEIIEERDGCRIQAEVQDFTEEQLVWWKSFGIDESILKKYNVHSIKNVFLNGNFLYTSSKGNPIYGYYFGKEEGRELWKMYFPLKVKYRFLLNTNKLQGVKQLPATGDLLIVTKSMKDVMVFNALGIAAVAPQAESVIISPRQYQALAKRFKYIVFNGDWDAAGQRFMFESRRRYKGVALSFTDKKKHAKDVSDFVKKFGFVKAQTFLYKVRDAILAGKFDTQFKYCKNDN